MDNSIEMQDQAMTAFGSHPASDVAELQKALSIADEYSTTVPGSLTQGAALAVEDLDRTLKLVTHGVEHFKLWKDIIKDRATQTVHEFNIQNRYGQEVPVFFTMGGTPQQTDAGYNRDVAVVKYLGTYGQVNHNLTLIQAAHGPVVAREVKNKTVELLERNERAMFRADSSINSLEYDGIDAQIEAKQNQAKYRSSSFEGFSDPSDDNVIIDLKGASQITEDVAEDACLLALNNFGMPMDMYLPTDDHSRFSKSFYAKERVRPGDRTAAGYLVPEFAGSLNFRFKPDLFVRPRRGPLSLAVSAGSAPTLANPLTPADALSQFEAADAGNYTYKISAVYNDGETLPSSASGTVAVAAGDKVTIEITYAGAPRWFNVFRSPLGVLASGWEFIGRVAPAGSGNAHNIDYNKRRPGLGDAFLLMHDPDVLSFMQLGSMIKYDLAVTDTSYKWLQLLYGMIIVRAPRKNVLIRNISR